MNAPSDEDARLVDLVRLNLIAGIGPLTQRRLFDAFGTVEAIFAAGERELQQAEGVGPKLAAALVAARNDDAPRRELARCREAGVQLILRGEAGYPPLLTRIPDAPSFLYARGGFEQRDELAVAIVGSRRCTLYGTQQAERLAGALARAGITIVSGLARGIDAAAHRGALQAGGRTIAVSATGLSCIYPPEHRDLADEIVSRGALFSESPLLTQPVPGLFPQRNRIISGMSLGVVLIEAGHKSGALHTARHAMEQGREVFALPGRVDQPHSRGCHDLIRDGVTLATCAEDILEGLGPLVAPVQRSESDEVRSPRELTLNDQERAVLNLVTGEPIHRDEVLRNADMEAPRVLSTLTILEMKHMIRSLPGGYVARI